MTLLHLPLQGFTWPIVACGLSSMLCHYSHGKWFKQTVASTRISTQDATRITVRTHAGLTKLPPFISSHIHMPIWSPFTIKTNLTRPAAAGSCDYSIRTIICRHAVPIITTHIPHTNIHTIFRQHSQFSGKRCTQFYHQYQRKKACTRNHQNQTWQKT